MRTLYLALASALIGATGCSTAQPRPVAASSACDRLGDTTNQSVAELFDSGDVYAAGDATERRIVSQGPPEAHTVGAELYVHATPGMTAEFLQRQLECYTAHGGAADRNDPFHPEEGSVTAVHVVPTGDSFTIRIIGSDDRAVADISKRAHALTATGSAQQVSRASTPSAPF